MSTSFLAANVAYGQAQRLVSNPTKVTPDPVGLQKPQEADFGQMVADSLQSVVDTGKTSDKMTTDMLNGKANVVDVVTAVSQTELAIDSLVTVRDKVISAYEQIMSMPI